MQPRIVIFARWPQAGRAKTRLIPRFGAQGAAQIYRKLLARTISAARDSGLPFALRVTGGEGAHFRETYGADLALEEQGEGDLGARLARVEGPALVIGSDCPALDGAMMVRAAAALKDAEVVVGPASDGGYYLIGFRDTPQYLFADMEWSTPEVFAETIARLEARGIAPALLPELSDVDEPDDLVGWPELLP